MQEVPQFEALPMRKRTLHTIDSNIYSVMDAKGKTVNVTAGTAYEAFKLSGMQGAIRIERVVNIKQTILQKKHFVDTAETAINTQETAQQGKTLLEQAIRERKQVFSPDDMLRIVANLSHAIPTPHVTDPRGEEFHGDGFDEIIPSQHHMRTVAANTAPVNAATILEPDIAVSDPVQPSAPAEALSQETIEKLLRGE